MTNRQRVQLTALLACIGLIAVAEPALAAITPRPTRPHGRPGRVYIEARQEGGSFPYFVAVVIAFAATGLTAQVAGRRVARDGRLRWRWVAALGGAAIGTTIFAAFSWLFGSPNNHISGTLFLGAIFVSGGWQLAWRGTTAANSPGNSVTNSNPAATAGG